jgi:succinoglycan biosynthesis transport protein ExoP
MKEKREIVHQPASEVTDIDRAFEPQIVPASDRYPSYRGGYGPEGSQFLDYWRAIRKRLWLVLGITVLVSTWTAIYMARKPNIYQAHAVIQVDLEQANPDLVTSESKRPVFNSDPSYFNTQLQLLGSESLLRRVVKEHNLDSNKSFQLIKSDASTSTWRSILKSIGLANDDNRTDKPEVSVPDASNSSTLASGEEIAQAIRLAPYVELIRRDLSVEPIREPRATVKDTRLIDVSYRCPDPELAAYVANSIGETFTNANQEKRSGTNRKTNDFLQERIADLQSEIRTDEQNLVDLKQKEGILKTEGDQTIVLDRLSGLNKQLLEAENQRKNAEANFLQLNKSPDSVRSMVEEQMAPYITQQENNIRLLQSDTTKKIADLQQRRTQLLQDYKEAAPEIKDIDVQIKSYQESIDKAVAKFRNDLEDYRSRTTKDLLANLNTKFLQAKDQEDKIRTDFNKQYDEAQGQNQGAVMLRLLEQKIETNKGFLENLVKQQSSNDVAAKGTDNNISVTEIAIPPDVPVSPRRLTTVLAALFLSTLFGIGLALVLEYLDDTIRTTEEIEKYLGLPALAAIPSIDSIPKRRLLLVGSSEDEGGHSNPELLINADSRSSLGEAYRQLRTLILLSTAGHAPKSLLITSSLPSEGKTTTAANTAISLAQTGAKVLIIDADMRRPKVHSVFNMVNGDGLSTLLSSELNERQVLDIICVDEGTKLNIMTSGPVPPNPAELIGSEQMANLLKILQKHYTHVIVDSPPIASFTDGVLIASMVDGVILVVHAGKSSRQIVRRSRQLLQDIGAKVLGVVLNRVNLRSQDNYYYYQTYYHRNSYESTDES